jgi:hypothetical protein
MTIASTPALTAGEAAFQVFTQERIAMAAMALSSDAADQTAIRSFLRAASDHFPDTVDDWTAQWRDIAYHGCQAGVPGLSYYHETGDLYDKHHEGVWSIIASLEARGEESPLTGLALPGGPGNHEQMANWLVWAAVEMAAWSIPGVE